jgi:hypothetical protein
MIFRCQTALRNKVFLDAKPDYAVVGSDVIVMDKNSEAIRNVVRLRRSEELLNNGQSAIY